MTDAVNHPRHYNVHPSGVECIDVIRDMCCDAANATKYVWRAWDKGNPVQDLDKARFYLEDQLAHAETYRPHSADTTDKLLQVLCYEQNSMVQAFYLAMAHHNIQDAFSAVKALLAMEAWTPPTKLIATDNDNAADT